MEIDVLRYASKISCEAHKHIMKNLKPGMHEYQGEALFCYYVYNYGGCRAIAYTCICASGENAGILHYGHAAKPNDKQINDGDLWYVNTYFLYILLLLLFLRLIHGYVNVIIVY